MAIVILPSQLTRVVSRETDQVRKSVTIPSPPNYQEADRDHNGAGGKGSQDSRKKGNTLGKEGGTRRQHIDNVKSIGDRTDQERKQGNNSV